jgi:hypothetical protein
MQSGVKILLERMKTNPEEFVSDHRSSKWQLLIDKYQEVLSKEELEALKAGVRDAVIHKFNEEVIKTLMSEDTHDLDAFDPFNVPPNYPAKKRMYSSTVVNPSPSGTVTFKGKGRYKTP